MRNGFLLIVMALAFSATAQAADLTLFADAEFTPRDIDPMDGTADVFVGGNPEVYKYLFIKAGTEDRACAEFDLASVPCVPARAILHFFIRTLDDGLPPDPVELKSYEANGQPDLVDFDPPDGRVEVVFDGPIEDPFNSNGCPHYYAETSLDVSRAFHDALVHDRAYLGFVFRDTILSYPSHRFDIYSNTWNCQPPSECCEESYIAIQVTYLTPGDGDEDGDVDIDDLPVFLSCLSGPKAGVAPTCEPMDMDCSGTVDLEDFAAFQAAFAE